jgi:hypothetical protein
MGTIQKVSFLTLRMLWLFIQRFLDVARAVETAFKYRDYFRKVNLLRLKSVSTLNIVFAGCHCRSHRIPEVVSLDIYCCLRLIISHTCTLVLRGHNELDEPAFTQPRMYEKIRTRKSVPQLYEDKLIVRH